MSTGSATIAISANAGTAKTCVRKRNYLRTNSLVMQKARSLAPRKTAEFIAEITGRPLRTVEYWLSTERLPGEAIGALIQSEHGFEFVAAIADAARPKWWREVRRALALTDERFEQAREAQHAAAELAAAIARASAAVGLQPEDMAALQAPRSGEAVRQILGSPTGPRISHRAVAPEKGPRR
jgi:hypothetical protein